MVPEPRRRWRCVTTDSLEPRRRWRCVTPDSLEPSLGALHAPSMARDGPVHRASATRMHSTLRLGSGMAVEKAVLIWNVERIDNLSK